MSASIYLLNTSWIYLTLENSQNDSTANRDKKRSHKLKRHHVKLRSNPSNSNEILPFLFNEWFDTENNNLRRRYNKHRPKKNLSYYNSQFISNFVCDCFPVDHKARTKFTVSVKNESKMYKSRYSVTWFVTVDIMFAIKIIPNRCRTLTNRPKWWRQQMLFSSKRKIKTDD